MFFSYSYPDLPIFLIGYRSAISVIFRNSAAVFFQNSVLCPRVFFAISIDKTVWYICLIDINNIFQYCRNSSRRSSFNMPGHIKLIKGAVDPDPTGEQNWSTFSFDIALPQNFCCQVLIWRRTTRTSRTTPRSPSGSTTPRTAATGRASWRSETSCWRSPLPNALCQLVIIYIKHILLSCDSFRQIYFQDMKSSRCRPKPSAGWTPPSKLQHEIILTYIHTQILTYFYSFANSLVHFNSHRFEKCEDMVNLTYLNDASVFWNLKTRYQAKMIHTYSGIFSYSGILAYSLFHPNRPVCDCDQPLQAVPALHPQVKYQM